MDDVRGEIFAIVEAVWASLLFAEVIPAETDASLAPPHGSLRGRIEISGAWNGWLLLDLAAADAGNAACVVFETAPGTETLADAEAVVAEIANVLAGNLKALLPQPSKLGLPEVERHAGPGWPPPHPHEAWRFGFSWQGSDFFVAAACREA